MSKEKQNTARRHHIIPQMILKRFSDNRKVWILDRINNSLYQTNIANAALEKDYYSVETTGEAQQDCVEQGILSKIEGIADPIIHSLLESHQMPNGEDWDYLANFLAVMYFRGPTFRSMVKKGYKFRVDVIDEHIHSNKETWQALMKEISEKEGIELNIDYEDALQARQHMKINIDIPNNYLVKETLVSAEMFVPIFAEMTPNLEVTDVVSDIQYVISDCPIIPIPRSLQPTSGWSWYRNPDAELVFPLSSNACLVLNYDKLRKVANVRRRRVALINHIVACNCERVIISRKKTITWRRENTTISTSSDELLEFLKSFDKKPSEIRFNEKATRKACLDALKERDDSPNKLSN